MEIPVICNIQNGSLYADTSMMVFEKNLGSLHYAPICIYQGQINDRLHLLTCLMIIIAYLVT